MRFERHNESHSGYKMSKASFTGKQNTIDSGMAKD